MLNVRSNIVIVPSMRDSTPTSGPIDNLAITSTGFTEAIDVGTFAEGIAMILTAATGGTNPTLDCDVQYGFLDSNNQYHWVDSGDSFTQITGNGLAFKKLSTNFGKFIRFRMKIGGTNTPTFTATMRLALKG